MCKNEIMGKIDCPKCNGEGYIKDHTDEHKGNRNSDDCDKYGCPVWVECPECLGTGIYGYD